MRGFEEGLVRAVRHAGASVLAQGHDLRILWTVNLPSPWRRARPGMRESEFLPESEAAKLAEVKRRVLATGRTESIDLAINTRWFDIWIDPCLDAAGSIAGVVTTIVDTTEHRQREQVLRTLLREVSHRSKNLLAIIQSVAAQTARYSDTIEQFLERFRGRLQSLASSQDLVTLSNWRGADLSELVADQIRRSAVEPRNRIRFTGVNLHLNPNAALHIGLALHELTTNSLSYGALSQAEGQIAIDAKLVETGGERRLRILWNESLTGASEGSPEKRFGSLALERVVPTSLRGRAEWRIGAHEVTYDLVVPATSVLS
ncbi:MAG: histidine kinase [Mesorhizobium amorphae]|nr:MAG: histidine kinase [Mesorhizobium amorphae]